MRKCPVVVSLIVFIEYLHNEVILITSISVRVRIRV